MSTTVRNICPVYRDGVGALPSARFTVESPTILPANNPTNEPANTPPANTRATSTGSIPTFVEPLERGVDRDAWGDRLADVVESCAPDLVILSGFMRVLPPTFVHRFAPMIINTHPSFLPEFPGAHAVRDASAAGVTETGASVIVVDDGVDTGPILAQRRVPVLDGDTETVLHDRIKIVERELLAEVVRDLAARESAVLQEN
jgi:phosphoribosylglycinamide formyltransferase-1